MKTLKEAIAIMESGAIFSCEVVSYDRKRKTGGKRQYFHEAVLMTGEERREQQAIPEKRMLTEKEKRKILLNKRPNHSSHFTRNIRIVQDGHPTNIIKKIHPPLMLEINGEKIVL